MPEASAEIVPEKPIEKVVTKNIPMLDQITLRQLKVEFKDNQFLRISEENCHQELTDIVNRGAKGLPTLLYYFRHANDKVTKKKLLRMICALKPNNLQWELEEIFKTGDNDTRLIIINKICHLGYFEMIPLFKNALENRKPDNSEYIPLAQALKELGDKLSARLAFEKYLMTGKKEFRTISIEAILELGFKESIPILKMLEVNKDLSEEEYFLVKKALLTLGEVSVLGDLIEMGLQTKIHRDQIMDVLYEYKPIIEIFNSYVFEHVKHVKLIDKDIFLRIVDEWYHDTILKKPSPYRPPIEVIFPMPFSEEKLSAWQLLKEECAKNMNDNSVFRIFPPDPLVADFDFQREIIMIEGNGHGGSLNIYICHPELEKVKIYLFSYKINRKQNANGIYESVTSIKICSLDKIYFEELVSRLRVILDSKLVFWWGNLYIKTSNNFTISFFGLGKNDADIFSFCGFQSSGAKINYLKLFVAKNQFLDFLQNKELDDVDKEDLEYKKTFSRVFIQLLNKWTVQKENSWVQDRMMKLACEFGDETLISPIKILIEEKFKRGDYRVGINECDAIDTLAKLTKTDFRFDTNGTRKNIEIVVREYLEFLKNN